MTILINIACYVTGLITGVALMAVIAAKAYQKGKEDSRAYDVEKVVKELKRASKTMLPVIPTQEAIDIVRKGGTV